MAFPFPQMSRRRSAGYSRSAFGRGGGSRSGFGQRGKGIPIRLLIGLAIVAFSLFSYYFKTDANPITGEEQRVALDDEADEVAIGLQAAPQMAQQHGGFIENTAASALVDQVGEELVRGMEEVWLDNGQSPYPFEFHLLQDPKTVNAFALPGGQVFITRALYDRLETRGRLAGVLGHEIGHVIARHGNQRMAEQKRNQGIMSGVAVASGSMNTARMAQLAVQVSSMAHGREQELESDKWGVRLMPIVGYNPEDLIEVMNILEAASGGSKQPEFASTHPSPDNRRQTIADAIADLPQELPGVLDRVDMRKTDEPLPPIGRSSRSRGPGPSLRDLFGG